MKGTPSRLVSGKESTRHNTTSCPQDSLRMRVLQQDQSGDLRQQGPQHEGEDIHGTKRQLSGSIGFRLSTPWYDFIHPAPVTVEEVYR